MMIVYRADAKEEQAVREEVAEAVMEECAGVNRIAHLFSSDEGPAAEGKLNEDAPNILQFVRPSAERPTEQIKTVASNLRDALGQFIEKGINMPPSEMGFNAEAIDPLDVSDLKEALYETSRMLESFFRDDRDQSPEGISMRSLGQSLQGAIDSFRVMLTRSGFSGEVPRSHETAIIDSAIEFKQDISSVIQKADAFALQMSMQEMDIAG